MRGCLTSLELFEFEAPSLCLLEGLGGEELFWVEQGCDIIFPNQDVEVQSVRMTDPVI